MSRAARLIPSPMTVNSRLRADPTGPEKSWEEVRPIRNRPAAASGDSRSSSAERAAISSRFSMA